MPRYHYIAKSKEDEKDVSGTMEALNKKELAKKLREEDLFLVKVEELDDSNKSVLFRKVSLFPKRVSLKDKIFFTRNLQMMLSGGLSLSRTLSILSVQTRNEKMKSALLQIKEEISKGKSFSEALDMHPKIFSKMFRSVIRLSEETGAIEENLGILTKQMEKEHELKSKVKGALIYPCVILVMMIIAGFAMMIFVVPRLTETFDSMGASLPLPTRMIIGFADVLASTWMIFPFLLLILFFVVRWTMKTEKGKNLIDLLLLKLPLVSSIIKKSNSAYTARTLSSLLSSGVPIVRGLEIVSDNISNSHFKKAISQSILKVKKGGSLSDALSSHSHLYSPLMLQVLEVGEETGQTSKVLSKSADFLEEEVFALTKNLTSIIEPALMVVMGVFVGFFAISMLLPMYSVLEVL